MILCDFACINYQVCKGHCASAFSSPGFLLVQNAKHGMELRLRITLRLGSRRENPLC